MLVSEVAQVLRLSRQTVLRRNSDGSLGFRHIDRGKSLIFAKADLQRLLEAKAPEPKAKPATWDGLDPQAFRAARAAQRRGANRPKREPSRPSAEPTLQTRVFGLSIMPGVIVHERRDGSFAVSYVRNRNHRPQGWPPVTHLPRGNPGPVRLDTEADFKMIMGEILAVTREWRDAVKAENAASKPR